MKTDTDAAPSPAIDLFLSFASADRERVAPPVATLQRRPRRLHLDMESDPEDGAQGWPHRERLARSRLLTIVWSDNARRLLWVGHELFFALRASLHIVVVRLDAQRFHRGLERCPFVDLRNWDGDPAYPTYRDLERLLTDALGAPEELAAPPHVPLSEPRPEPDAACVPEPESAPKVASASEPKLPQESGLAPEPPSPPATSSNTSAGQSKDLTRVAATDDGGHGYDGLPHFGVGARGGARRPVDSGRRAPALNSHAGASERGASAGHPIAAPASEDEPRALLRELDHAATDPRRRREIGARLHALGDPRPGIGLDAGGLPSLDWVSIPPGEMRLADGRRFALHGFQVRRYAVTHRQFDAFISAGGYDSALAGAHQTRHWWRIVRRIPPRRAPEPDALGNHPRTNLSCYEAMVFCLWLSEARGEAIILPSELQWLRAARGDTGRIYPWGDIAVPGRANVAVDGLQLTLPTSVSAAAVGIFPGDVSPLGVMDLGGNTHEWCLTAWDCSNSAQSGLHKERGMKGGSFPTSQWRAMIDARPNAAPDLRWASIGFRVVRPALTSVIALSPATGENYTLRRPADAGATRRDAS